MLALHFDAAVHAPGAWLEAVWWRMLGKKVRARARFAPLFAASPHAYRLWLKSEKSPEDAEEGSRAGPPIIALVASGAGQDKTLDSLAEQGVEAFLIGSPEVPAIADAAREINLRIGDETNVSWFMPLTAGDILAPGAVDAYRGAVGSTARASSTVIYADDDLIDLKGARFAPHFKPGWNAELFEHFDYLTGACIVSASAADLARLPNREWAEKLVSSAIRAGMQRDPVRIPHILHHRRTRPIPRVPAVPAAAAGEALPKVSVIIPTRNRVGLLRTCIEGLNRTAYARLEVIVVDNGSDDPETLDYLASLDPARHQVLRDDGPFNFSRLNNRAAKLASGDLLCLLNNDIEILASDWLDLMARQALRPEVGAVGARLLYPDGRIQHAGVVLGICGGAAHAHRLLNPEERGYFQRHALPQFVSAVTAACLVVRRESFEAVGGLDEENFAVAFNDVDLCLRLNQQGWQSLYEPRATLVHHESVSRGLDRDPVGAARLAGELAALQARWRTHEEVDPFHNPQLSRFSERFAVGLEYD